MTPDSVFVNSSGFFLQKNDPLVLELKQELIRSIKAEPSLMQYDQYANYNYSEGFSADNYFLYRLEALLNAEQGDWTFFYQLTSYGPYLIGTRLSKWDEEHFGFKMANLQIFTVPKNSPNNQYVLGTLVKNALDYLKKEAVSFVSSRVNGDHIVALHTMEDSGFRYYDNVIWPITSTANKDSSFSPIRLIKPEDINEVRRIAENFQYPRGHYYCDERFDKKTINAMYPKWIDTTLKNKEHISVIESDGKVAGLFVFKIDQELERFTGFKYGRLRLLALDNQFRGQGLGEKIFGKTLSLIKDLGADYIDSGYSTKNHISAKLHVKNSFFSVYEEVTFHLWLK